MSFPAKSSLSRALTALALALLCSSSVHAKTAAPAVPQTFYPAFVDQYDITGTDTNSGFSQAPAGVALDSRGNVIVTGCQIIDNSDTREYYTAKYDALDGHLDWSSTFAGAGNAIANSVAVDSQGNVYVGGGAILGGGANELFYLIKYSGTDGSTLWSQSYDGTAGGQNEIRKVIVDPGNNVIVTGISEDTGDGLDFATVKYNSSGLFQWAQTFDLAHQDDIPSSLACDGTGNVFVAGSATDVNQNQAFVTLAYTAAGALAWTGTYESPAANSTSGAFTYGATSVAVDSQGNAITTGHYTDASGNDGFYTVKYSSIATTSGTVPNILWSAILPGSDKDGTGGARSVAVDGNNNVLVAGALSNDGNDEINLVKYSGTDGSLLWSIMDNGTAGGPSHAAQVTTDGGNNAIVVGDAGNGDVADGVIQDIYVAKYDQGDGHLIWSSGFEGSFTSADNLGTAAATDANGNIIITGTESRFAPDGETGLLGIVTIKYDRFLLETNDPLPPAAGLAANPTIFAIDPPALADSNGFATLVTVNSGKAKPTAILTENNGGGLQIPAVQKASTGSVGAYSLFSDPVSAPNGNYAFAAKLAGVPGSHAGSAWMSVSGTLSLVLQEGNPVPGVAGANVSLIDSLSMRDDQLLALLKVSGPAATSSLLLGLDPAGNGTPLVRSGQQITLGAASTTVKTIVALSPTVLSPGDGRWQGDANAVVKIVAANKATAICSVSNGGVLTPLLYTGESASGVVNGATWSGFGLPGIGPTGEFYTTLGTLTGGVSKTDNTVLVTSSGGGAFAPFLQSGATYTSLTDPIVNSSGDLATIASLSSSKKTQVLLYGNVSGGLSAIAQTGDAATDVDGNADTPTYDGFVDFVLPSGAVSGPVFVAKLAGAGVTPKTNMGLWGYGTGGAIRRLLRTGDTLGTRTVASFTVLKAPSKSFAAARNFNATGQVAVMVIFTDKTQGLINIGIP